MATIHLRRFLGAACTAVLMCGCCVLPVRAADSAGEWMVTDNPAGHTGGRLAVALRSEPKTLNPVLALDETSREIIHCLTADLIHINRGSQKTEPALAKSWSVSRDGRQYTLQLPRHLLETAYRKNDFSGTWSITTPAAQFAGLGAFRLKEYVPGQRIALERNPFYWKQDRNGVRLPYVDEIDFLFVPSEDAQVIRFQSGDTDILSRFSADNFAVLEKQEAAKGYRLRDLGPGMEYNFLFFNLNEVSSKDLPDLARKQAWFQDVRFRQAVSAAVDRDGIVRLVYSRRATPLWGHVTPGNKLWGDAQLPHPAKSPERARALLKSAGFSWKDDGSLADPRGSLVEFSILTSSSNAQRTKMATIIQDDLARLGMKVHVVSLEFGAVVSRLMKSHDYDACIMGLVSGDADPTPEMNVWLSSGDTHLWHPKESHPATPWEAEIDGLMHRQLITLDYPKRKRLYDQVQEIIAQNMPIICLASPNILVAAKNRVGNFQPAILDSYTLWNVEQLYLQ